MNRTIRVRIATALALLIGARARVAFAQGGPAAVRLRAARTDTIALDSTRAVTAVFALRNESNAQATAMPSVIVPSGWTTVNATSLLPIAAGATETWLASVSAPANAAAGLYVVRARTAPDQPVADSIFVRVAEHRAIDVLPMDVPGWVVSGGDYQARFIVRNRGNVTMTLALTGATTRGRRCTVDVPSATLAPGATVMATVRVVGAPNTLRASDDVVELTAADVRDANTRVTIGARTTIVPLGNAVDDRATLPAELSVRGMSGGAGVSPVSLTSAGLLGDNKTWVDLSYHARPSFQSTFGEREEYHVAMRREGFNARLGDGLYGYTSLTSASALGIGGSAEGAIGGLGVGGYAERSRWGFNQPIEMGAYAGSPRAASRGAFATVVARRLPNGMMSEVGSISSRVALPNNGTLSVEVAGSSDSAGTTAMAERVRANGTLGAVTYDVGHARGAPTFAGWQRGLQQQDALLTWSAARKLTFSTSGQMTTSTPPPGALLVSGQRFANVVAGGNFAGLLTVDYVRTMRHDFSLGGLEGTQQGVRTSASVPAGPLQFSATLDRGVVDEATTGVHRGYGMASGSMRVNFGNGRGITLFGDFGDGKSLGADGRDVMSGGASAQIRLPLGVDLNVLATGSTLATTEKDARLSYGQLDAQIERKFTNGATLAMRVHLWANGQAQGALSNQLMYFEVRAPLHLPVGRPLYGRRVEGRVLEAATGKPVSGTLVRVGDQAAVTDRNGRVTLAGLQPGKYAISIETPGAASRSMIEGAMTVEVHPNATKAATFTVQLAEAGRVRAAVRKLGFASSLATDSLVDEGMQANVLVALEGVRDTLYQTSDDRGRIDFGNVPVGTWTVAVRGDEAASARRVSVAVQPGGVHTVDVKLVPQRRAVTFVGGGELKVRDQKNQRDP